MSEYEVGVGTQSGNLLLNMNFDMGYILWVFDLMGLNIPNGEGYYN